MTFTEINWNDSQFKISNFFIVGEVTKNDRRRIPPTGSEIEREIFQLALELDKIREKWGVSDFNHFLVSLPRG
ncbi:MAG: hypothetical protein RLZZ143_2570 [Cyanobacteriota bacterium]|jgi:hypothetical protein